VSTAEPATPFCAAGPRPLVLLTSFRQTTPRLRSWRGGRPIARFESARARMVSIAIRQRGHLLGHGFKNHCLSRRERADTPSAFRFLSQGQFGGRRRIAKAHARAQFVPKKASAVIALRLLTGRLETFQHLHSRFSDIPLQLVHTTGFAAPGSGWKRFLQLIDRATDLISSTGRQRAHA